MIILDGSQMTTCEAMHAHLKQQLELPDYYGNNLNALDDCLGDLCESELVVLTHANDFLQACGEYGAKMLGVFTDNGHKILLD